MSIPVICDRCRTAGLAGAGDFSHLGDLLEFDPVPRRVQRADGWTPEKQRAFIATLAVTGSKRRAAMAIGMAAFGVDQMLKHDGADSFRAAYDRAMAIAKANGTMRIASGVADAAARNAAMTPPSRLRGHEPDEEQDEVDEEAQFALLDNLFRKFLFKVQAERTARLGGEVVAADFYLRQITFVEIALDLIAEGLGLGAWQALADQRRGGHNIFHLAETDMSRLLDAKRRDQWAEMEPNRPEHPPQRYLVQQSARRSGGDGEPVRETISLEPQICLGKAGPPPPGVDAETWREVDFGEQQAMLKAHYAKEAEAQMAWERESAESRPTDGNADALA